MPKYTEDGGVIPSGMPTSQRSSNAHYKMFGVYRAMIIRAIYPDDVDNTRKDRMEYVIRVKGQDYKNAVDACDLGGIHNYNLKVRKEISESSDGQIATSTPREKMNGESVYVMFVEGNGNVPLIIGSDQHPRHAEYNKTSREEGVHSVSEFNGIEISIDKSSNYTIKNVGRKDDKGAIQNQEGVGSHIKMFENGDIELDTHDTDDTASLRIRLTKKDKKMEFYSQDNKVIYDDKGVSIIDKNANEFIFSSAGLMMKSASKTTMESSADTSITSGGKADIKATGAMTMSSDAAATFKGTAGTNLGTSSAPTKVDGATVLLAGGGKPIATLGSKAIGTGNLGAPVVSTIIQGSPKVSAP